VSSVSKSSSSSPSPGGEPSGFEQSLARLEAIVSELDRADLPLEASIRLFEEGMRLSHACRRQLEEAEGKVEILMKREGGMKAEAFEPPETRSPDE
jgi:exodeoxyribonuclease VII small subunit